MNINTFFVLIFVGLIMIFVGFKPENIAKQEFVDVPLFEIDSFVLHELNQDRLITIMKGTKTKRYSDRYSIVEIQYTDNSKELLSNIRADKGLYRDIEDVISLSGNVIYNREDGLIFESQEAIYDKKKATAKTTQEYVMYRAANRVVGNSLFYDTINKKVSSKDVVAKYKIKER